MTTYLKDGRWHLTIYHEGQNTPKPRLSKTEQTRLEKIRKRLDKIADEREAREMTREVWE